MTHLLLARHGQTEWNVAGRIQGQTNSDLTGRGREQAQMLARRVAGLPIAAVWSSDLSRARDTAVTVADALGLPVVLMPGLREKSYGDWEGLTQAQIRDADPDGWRRYFARREFDAPVPNGETWPQVQARMADVLQQALRDFPGAADTVLLVGHGGSLRTLFADALEAPLVSLRHFLLDNASLSRLDFLADRPARLGLVNDTSHLEQL